MANESDYKFNFSIDGITGPFRVVAFEGVEAMSELFSFRITLGAEDSAIDLDSALGKTAVLTMNGGDEPRFVHGIVSRFEQDEEGKDFTLYHATLVPQAYRLIYRQNCRIFQDTPVPQIIEKVLKSAGLVTDEFRFSLFRSYLPKEYSVQYRESDWAFIARLMEEEGIFSFFEHTERGHVLAFGDAPFANPAIGAPESVFFDPATGLGAPLERISKFRFAGEMRPGKVTMRDFNFSLPKLQLEVTAEASRDKDLEIYDYPGEYVLPQDGSARVVGRLEDFQVDREKGSGEASCNRFLAGHVFTLEQHQNEAFNRKYLLVRVEHHGTEPQTGDMRATVSRRYFNRFTVIPAATPYRSAERTPKPAMRGVQTAIVVGPAGEEIYTDEFGRVKVQFHWDREGKFDDKSSCWVRVSQIWAGASYGSLYIPRVGHEVIVDFLEGDPDRPIITGRVYHGTNVTPYPLPGSRTQSTIKSNSSPGGGGSNELRFEDLKGQEEIFVHAQKDWTIVVENDKNQEVGHDETLLVKNDRSKRVDMNQKESIGSNKTIDVGLDHTEKIKGNESISVGETSTKRIEKDHNVDIGGAETLTVGGDQKEDVSGNRNLTIAQDSTLAIKGAATTNIEKTFDTSVKGDMTVAVSGNSVETVDKDKTLDVTNLITLKSGAGTVTIKKDGTLVIECKDLTITASGEVKIQGSDKLTLKSSGPINLTADGAIKIKGSTIDMN